MQGVPHPWKVVGGAYLSPTIPDEPGMDLPYLSLDAGASQPLASVGSSASLSPESKNVDQRADLDLRFLSDLWQIVVLAIDRHPLSVMLSELGFVALGTALWLWLLH
jgi:hypothetical protein